MKYQSYFQLICWNDFFDIGKWGLSETQSNISDEAFC